MTDGIFLADTIFVVKTVSDNSLCFVCVCVCVELLIIPYIRWSAIFSVGKKSTIILPPVHDRVLIQSAHGEDGLFTDGSVFNVYVREGGARWG